MIDRRRIEVRPMKVRSVGLTLALVSVSSLAAAQGVGGVPSIEANQAIVRPATVAGCPAENPERTAGPSGLLAQCVDAGVLD